MYLGHLAQSHPLLPPVLRQELARLAGEFDSLKTQACGRYPLEGDKLFYLVQEGMTALPQALQPEYHEEYLDIQLVITSYSIHYTKLYDSLPNSGVTMIMW